METFSTVPFFTGALLCACAVPVRLTSTMNATERNVVMGGRLYFLTIFFTERLAGLAT